MEQAQETNAKVFSLSKWDVNADDDVVAVLFILILLILGILID